jgi:hypothetical protein
MSQFCELKFQATTQHLGKHFFYKQALEFHRPSTFLRQTSRRQNRWSLLSRVLSLYL